MDGKGGGLPPPARLSVGAWGVQGVWGTLAYLRQTGCWRLENSAAPTEQSLLGNQVKKWELRLGCSRPAAGQDRVPSSPPSSRGLWAPFPAPLALTRRVRAETQKLCEGNPSHSFILIYSFARLFIPSFYKLRACPGAEPGNPKRGERGRRQCPARLAGV